MRMTYPLLLATVVTLFLSCSPHRGTGGDQSTGEESAAAADHTGRIAAPVERTDPTRTDTLAIDLDRSPPASLNPWRDPSDIELLLFPRAIRRDPETLEWEPWMAESWSFYEDLRGVEVVIRPGALWSSGEEVSSRDWVEPANRYFQDPGLRTSYRDDPRYAGLEPRWIDLGPRRFAVVVSRPTDRATLFSLLRLPPMPPGALTEEDGSQRSTRDLNRLWRLDLRAEGTASGIREIAPGVPPSAGPYEVASLSPGGIAFTFSRRPGYRDPAYGSAAARELRIRYLDAAGDDGAHGDLIVTGLAVDGAGATGAHSPGESPDSALTPFLAGSDLTPAVGILRPGVQEGGVLREALVAARGSFLRQRGEADGGALFGRAYPAIGDARALAPWLVDGAAGDGAFGDTPGSSQAVGGGSGTEGEEGRSVTILTAADRDLVAYSELLTEELTGRGLAVEVVEQGRGALAEALLSGEGWEIILIEISEQFDAHLGDPLVGNLLPLSGEWSRLASGAPARALTVEPLSTAELSALREGELNREEASEAILRLWRNIALATREADRQRAVTAFRELWDRFQPWVYLFDRSRVHYSRGAGNLIFRHLPGSSLGETIPLIYLPEEGS